MGNLEELLGVREVSRLLGIKKATLYGWVHKGKIPVIKVGSRLRFKPSEISRWLKQRERKGEALK